jgi:hypothetical protein
MGSFGKAADKCTKLILGTSFPASTDSPLSSRHQCRPLFVPRHQRRPLSAGKSAMSPAFETPDAALTCDSASSQKPRSSSSKAFPRMA